MPLDEYSDGFSSWTTSFRLVGSGKLEVVTASRGFFLGHYGVTFSPGNRFIFDLSTGHIVSEDFPLRRRTTIATVVVLVGIAVVAVSWLFNRKGRIVRN